jgi:L-ascorbate metabolism protein UlaG (beta-lactamase superfamily)
MGMDKNLWFIVCFQGAQPLKTEDRKGGAIIMRITYWRHSGFSVETDNCDILIDYIGGGYAMSAKPVIALISHGHFDHRAPDETLFANHIIDCPDVGREYDIMGVKIRTYGSTDEGVSFMIDVGSRRIFHAGDLNKWHWRDEGDAEWTEKAISDFEAVMATLPDEKIDVAMFPVDPRQGSGYDEGACEFNERIKPGIFIPMHFWDKPEAAEEFAKKYENVRALTESGQYVEI